MGNRQHGYRVLRSGAGVGGIVDAGVKSRDI